MYFTYKETKDLLEFFGGDEETEIAVIEVKIGDPNHSGPGIYAYYSEYPDEGTMLLGNGRKTDNQEIQRIARCPDCGATMHEDGCLFCGGSLDESR